MVTDKQKNINRLKKTIEVLESPHLREVKVKYLGIDDSDVRIFEAKTIVKGKKHTYTVRVQEWFEDMANEMKKDARCNCPAGSRNTKCRHALKVLEVDAEMLGKDLWVEAFQSYNTSRTEVEFQAQAMEAEIKQLIGELPDSVKSDVLGIVRTLHEKYGFPADKS